MKHIIHAVMLAFAGASLGNVRAFLIDAGHPSEVAWLLGLALGASLVTVSIMLTHVDRSADRQAFTWLVGAGLALGFISGALQAAEYAKHLHLAWGVLLGFGIPLGGEVGLAIAAGAYTKAQNANRLRVETAEAEEKSRNRFKGFADTVEAAVADQLEIAVGELDPTAIKRQVERTVNQLARQAVDSVAQKAAQFYTKPEQPNNAAEQAEQPVEQTEQNDVQIADLNTDPNNLDGVNDKRKAAKLNAQRDMLNIFRTNPHAPYRTVGEQIGRSGSTVSSWLNELSRAGVVHVNGNGVEVLQ
jgi:hypothetical protein